jgi:hypothetical protein
MQPTPYVKTTNFAQDESANVGGRSTVRTDRVDAELENIELSLTETQENLELIQRDDGRLRDGLVELFNLSAVARAALQADVEPRGLWATATVYAESDLVDEAGVAYLCAEDHVSGTFATDYAAGKWQVFGTNTTAAGIDFTPPSSMAATNVQAAIEEVNSASRAASLPTISAFYGGM